jgi:hypothetical protein
MLPHDQEKVFLRGYSYFYHSISKSIENEFQPARGLHFQGIKIP